MREWQHHLLMGTLSMSAISDNSFNFEDLLTFATWVVWAAFALYTLVIFISTLRSYGVMIAFIRLVSVRILGPMLIPISFTLFAMSLIFIPPQEVGVVISLLSPGGIRPQPVRAGLHWIVPILEWKETYPIYWQTYTMSGIAPSIGNPRGGTSAEGPEDSIRARTSDGQEVHLDTSIIFRVDEQQVVTDLVSPLIRGVVRSQVSQFTAREVNSSARRDLETTLDRQLREQLGEKGLLVDQFLLRDITFSDEFVAAIESKQVSVEQREQANYEAERKRILAQGDADAAITRANGQAESLKLIADALAQSDELVTYHYVEKLAPNIRVMLVPNNAPFILPLPDLESLDPLTTTVAAPPTESVTQTQEITPTQIVSVTSPLSVSIPVSVTVPLSGTVEP
jgi:regulator of protease activity HflC (stomatin/prohibitin superfamily)